jgi:hypothetical protein
MTSHKITEFYTGWFSICPNIISTYIVLKNSVHIPKRTKHFIITMINLLMLFKEIIPVYAKNHTKIHKYKMKHHGLVKQMVPLSF